MTKIDGVPGPKDISEETWNRLKQTSYELEANCMALDKYIADVEDHLSEILKRPEEVWIALVDFDRPGLPPDGVNLETYRGFTIGYEVGPGGWYLAYKSGTSAGILRNAPLEVRLLATRRLDVLLNEMSKRMSTSIQLMSQVRDSVGFPLAVPVKEKDPDTSRGVAGDYCEVGNQCGRLGCPECQQ